MTRPEIQTAFVRLFADPGRGNVATMDEALQAEDALATTFPISYLDFITTHGAVFTPSILDLVTGGESEIAPEGASWDVQEFFTAAELVETAQGYWSAGMESFLVPIAMDCMGNVFGFRRGKAESRPDDAPVLFFDHDFNKIHDEAASFDAWLSSFLQLQKMSAESSAAARALLSGPMHIHVKQDGSVLTLEQTSRGVAWHAITIDRLQRELQALKGRNTPVACSRDNPEADPPKLVEMVLKIITSFELPMQLHRDPPVPLNAR